MSIVHGWTSTSLGDLLISKNDKSKQIKSTEYATVGTFPVIDQSSKFICGYNDDVNKVIDTDLPITIFGDHTRHAKFIFFPFIAGADGTQLLKSIVGIDDRFCYYLVCNASEKIGNYGYDRHFKHLKEFQCSYPESKLEQSKIAEILSKVDRAIEQTEDLIVKQQKIKTGLMQDLLIRGIDKNGNLRSEETHKFKDSPLGRIPVEWECSLLSHFVPSAEYGISTSLGEFGTPVLRMNNFFEGEADISDLKYTDLKVPEKLWLRDGDVLFNRTNSWEHVGRTGIWRCQTKNATFASYLVRLNPDVDLLLSALLNIWLNWEPTQIAMRRLATPAVQQVNINPTNLRTIQAAFPTSLSEQGEIAKRFTRVRNTIDSNVESLAKLGSLKTALMQDLLTGKVRVTPLLEKIEVSL